MQIPPSISSRLSPYVSVNCRGAEYTISRVDFEWGNEVEMYSSTRGFQGNGATWITNINVKDVQSPDFLHDVAKPLSRGQDVYLDCGTTFDSSYLVEAFLPEGANNESQTLGSFASNLWNASRAYSVGGIEVKSITFNELNPIDCLPHRFVSLSPIEEDIPVTSFLGASTTWKPTDEAAFEVTSELHVEDYYNDDELFAEGVKKVSKENGIAEICDHADFLGIYIKGSKGNETNLIIEKYNVDENALFKLMHVVLKQSYDPIFLRPKSEDADGYPSSIAIRKAPDGNISIKFEVDDDEHLAIYPEVLNFINYLVSQNERVDLELSNANTPLTPKREGFNEHMETVKEKFYNSGYSMGYDASKKAITIRPTVSESTNKQKELKPAAIEVTTVDMNNFDPHDFNRQVRRVAKENKIHKVGIGNGYIKIEPDGPSSSIVKPLSSNENYDSGFAGFLMSLMKKGQKIQIQNTEDNSSFDIRYHGSSVDFYITGADDKSAFDTLGKFASLFISSGYSVELENKIEDVFKQATHRATSKITEHSSNGKAVTVSTKSSSNGRKYIFTS